MAREHDAKKRSSSSSSSKRAADVPQLSSDDYFLRATEFRVWLAQTKDKYVEDLSTDEAAALFRRKFVKKWNRGQLPSMFYDGIPEHVLEQTRRTKHTWGFAQRLSDREALELAAARDSVGVATRKSDLLAVPRAPPVHAAKIESHNKNSSSSSSSRSHRSSRDRNDASEEVKERSHHHKRKSHRGRDSSSDDDDDADRRRHRAHKADRKRHRKHHESVLEELAPKETGREALLEKRRQIAGRLHGAARDREENRDGLDVSEDFLMGGGGGDLQRRLQSREQARDRRQQAQQEKLDEFKAKEAARMDKFLQDMGISAGSKPITIAPRKN